MTPVLVTAPITQPVDLATLKLHLRVDHDDEDALIQEYADDAVSHLDGWTGILGRCIMPQEWKVAGVEGDLYLPMPDVTLATADYDAGPEVLEITATACGPMVTLTEDADVTFTCEMAPSALPAVKQIIRLLVGDAYENREAVTPSGMMEHSAVASRVNAIRWVRV